LLTIDVQCTNVSFIYKCAIILQCVVMAGPLTRLHNTTVYDVYLLHILSLI